jgi:hypothetical protein
VVRVAKNTGRGNTTQSQRSGNIWQVDANTNVCQINKSWKEYDSSLVSLHNAQLVVHLSNTPVVGKRLEIFACGKPQMGHGCLLTMSFLIRCNVVYTRNNRHISYEHLLARPMISNPVMTTVQVFWLLAGLFHTSHGVLLLPIASNTSVQLFQCRKNKSPRLHPWQHFGCIIKLLNNFKSPTLFNPRWRS